MNAVGPSRSLGPWNYLGAGAAIVVIALLSYVDQDRSLAGDEKMYWARAHAFEDVEADLLWPPLYPHFLRIVERVSGQAPRLAVFQAQLVLLLASVWLLARQGIKLGLSPRAAAAIGLALLTYAPAAAFAFYLWPEVLHLFLFLLTLELLQSEFLRIGAILAGATLGLALLTKSLLSFFVPVLVLAFVLTVEKRRRPVAATLLLVGLAVVVAPTVLENGRRTGRYVIASSAAFNLRLGLDGRSRHSVVDPRPWQALKAYRESSVDWTERDRLLWRGIGQHIEREGLGSILARQLGKQYFLLFDKDSSLVEQLPGGRLADQGEGYRRFGRRYTETLRKLSYAGHAILLSLFGAGLVLAPWREIRRNPWGLAMVGFLVYNLAIFLGLHVVSRYFFQMLPSVLIFAGFALDAWPKRRQIGAARWLVALLGALFFLFLGFGGEPLDHHLPVR